VTAEARQAGPNGIAEQSFDVPENPTVVSSRREFLGGALAVSSLALSGLREAAVAQPAPQPASAPPKIGEISSSGGRLRAVITIKNADRMMPGDSGAFERKTMVRYFEGKDASGNVVWPPQTPAGMVPPPLPGPTLRAQVGDQVEITFLNHVRVDEFAGSLDKAEEGDPLGCDGSKDGVTGKDLYPQEAGDRAPVCFHGSSTANIHWHGTHVTPDGLGDNVLLHLRPNPQVTEELIQKDIEEIFREGPPTTWLSLRPEWRERQKALLKEHDRTAIWKGVRGALPPELHLWPATEKLIERGLWPQYQIGAFPYCFKLTRFGDTNQDGKPYAMGQCPGTHWYHAHKHGSTATNVLNGMVGVFIIEGAEYDGALRNIDPRLKQTEKVLIVQNFGEAPNLLSRRVPNLLWVNGQLRPTITMQPGEVQLWRFVNASIRAVNTLLGFAPKNGAAPEIRQIAQDGVQFSFDNYKNQPHLRGSAAGIPPLNTFAPGNRVDLLVKAPLQKDSYEFRVTDTTIALTESLLTLRVEGDPISPAMAFPSDTERSRYLPFPSFLTDIDPSEIKIWRKLDFGWEPNRTTPGLNTALPIPGAKFMINDKQFSGGRYDQTMVLGDKEEWTLTNSTATIAHPFHIHVNPFQVVEIYDPNASDQLYKPGKNFVWHDVIAIPPARLDANGSLLLDPKTGKALDPGYVKIRHPFVDFAGSYVLHCHMLAHEDRGMMQLIRVIRGDQGVPSHQEDVTVPHH